MENTTITMKFKDYSEMADLVVSQEKRINELLKDVQRQEKILDMPEVVRVLHLNEEGRMSCGCKSKP